MTIIMLRQFPNHLHLNCTIGKLISNARYHFFSFSFINILAFTSLSNIKFQEVTFTILLRS